MGKTNFAADLIGKRFGRLIVIEKVGYREKWRSNIYRCTCDCGGERSTTSASALNSGATLSCGCLQKERAKAANLRHGFTSKTTKRSEYSIWTEMKQRCENPFDANYRHYGGRGIKVCERWSTDFSHFIAYMGERPSGMSIDRIDNNGNYEPGNCEWATRTQQARNSRQIKAVRRSDGAIFPTIIEAAESVGIHRSGIAAVCHGRQTSAGGFSWGFVPPALIVSKKETT